MPEPIDHQGYPTKPRQIDELSWFYEQRAGLVLVNEPIAGARTTTITIPWRKIEAAVDRRRALKRKPRRSAGGAR